MNEKFKVLAAGLDLSNLNYEVNLENTKFDFWATSLKSGNDHLYKLPTEGDLVVIVDFLDGLKSALEGHLKQIGRWQVDLLLVPARKDYTKLEEVLDMVGGVGIYNPENSEDLVESYMSLRSIIRPQYLGINLSPIEFRYDILKKAEELELEIISFNPFGGKLNYERCLDAFSAPYLLEFSSTYSSLVFLSSRDILTSQLESVYIENIIGKESSPIYKLEKEVVNLIKPLRRLVNTSLSFEDGEIGYRNPYLISLPGDLRFNLGSTVETTIRPGIPGEPFYDNFIGYIESICKYPKDGDDIDFITILKYKTIESLKSTLKKDETLGIIMIDPKTFVFQIKENYYLLTVKNHLPIFSEIHEIPVG